MKPTFGILLAACAASIVSAAPLADYVREAPFPMPDLREPGFPDRTVSIVDYGAVGNGKVLNTSAIARAIDACAQAGGGHVIIPPGFWLTGPIALRSHVDLHAQRGALIQFTSDHTLYPMARRPGRSGYQAMSCLHAEEQSDFAVTGEGIFDGAGETWRPVRHTKMTDEQWRALVLRGGVVDAGAKDWWPTKAAMEGEDYLDELARHNPNPAAEDFLPARDYLRSPLVSITRCDNVLIQGITLRNSPEGIFAPDRCRNLIVSGAIFFNEWWAQNGDGMDINNCRGVAVYQCLLSTGDDAICMKAGGEKLVQDEPGLQDVIVAECTVYHGHGGYVVGGTTESGMRRLWATRCQFIGTDAGIRVKSGLGHGGLVRDVFVDHIDMKDIATQAITFNTFYDNTPVSAAKVQPVLSRDASKTPEFRDFTISDVTCLGAGLALEIVGLPQMPVHAITLNRVYVRARRGFRAVDAADVTLRGVKIDSSEGPPVIERNTRNIQIEETP